MSKPQIVIVPGAWHAPFYMATVVSNLESLGYTIHAQQMPAVGSSNPPSDLSTDVAALNSMVEKAIDAGNDVVVICHSWGGMVTGSGLMGLSKAEREQKGKKGGVIRTGYMTAFIVDIGVSMMDAAGGKPAPWFGIQNRYVYVKDPNVLYNDLPPAEQQKWGEKLQCHAYDTFYAKATAASWKKIPTNYLLCEDDLAIPREGQQAMIEGVKAVGADIEVTSIKVGHSPFLSKVDETVAWIVGVAGR
ncbi:Alpha/beta hydrolase fold-1 [Bipolaris maydis]|nr:hypothetical protein BM1_07367 [Bipolaris maydis]KAJ6193599.1 Alpha/beta hydrolase fold-1 [Bipolaris maydis]KAJ6203493.1 Alpha/beta hydrolase fold-1 [Bipolaris maydis]KAJ6212295.1 Alpha/beta hydrolase fold-1 [Bipolaris maydis]